MYNKKAPKLDRAKGQILLMGVAKNDDFICEIHPQLSMKPFFKNRPLKYNEKLKKWIRDE